MTYLVPGTELLTNGALGASAGTGAGSVPGPGWTSDYAPCGPSIFAAPCGGGTFAFFDTNAGQVTANNANAIAIPARTVKSMAVNVSGNTADAIIEWSAVPLVNGQLYRFKADAAIINTPFSVALRIDGAVIAPLVAPAAASTWEPTVLEFTWTGTTGPHTVGIHSNSGVLGGNDHAFDNFSLRALVAAQTCGDCGCDPVPGSGGRCVPVFGPILNLPFDPNPPFNGTMTMDDQAAAVRRFEFDWSTIIPGLTGYVNVSFTLIGVAQQPRLTPPAVGIQTGNTTRCACFDVHFSQPVQLRRLNMLDFDGPGNETLYNIDPPVDSVSPNFTSSTGACANTGNCMVPGPASQTPGRGCVRSNAANQNGFVFWNAPTVTNVQWCVIHNQLLSTIFTGIDVQDPIAPRPVVRQICRDGTVNWVYADDGAVVGPADVLLIEECD